MPPKHTPAPWKKRRDDDETITILGKYSGTTIKIAEVYNTTDDETDADLILTAPELCIARPISIMTVWSGSATASTPAMTVINPTADSPRESPPCTKRTKR